MQLNEIDLWFRTMSNSLPSTTISYSRDGSLTVTGIKAILGRSTLGNESSDGAYTEVESIDFVIKKSALKDLQAPQRGDVILHGENMYEVIDPVFKNAEPFGRIIRVYGKLIAT